MKQKIFFLSIILFIIGVFAATIVLYQTTHFRTRERTIRHANKDRSFLIHKPPAYDGVKKLPLVIALHDHSQHPKLFEIDSGLSILADEAGFVIVYPYGTTDSSGNHRSWNAEFCCDPAAQAKVDDVGFIKTLIEELEKKEAIDMTRIFVVGYANGALLAHQIATNLDQQITAAAMINGSVGGTPLGEEEYKINKNGRPVPVVMFHGRNDTTIPYIEGLSNVFPVTFNSFQESSSYWAVINGCSLSARVVEKTETFIHTDHPFCLGNTQVHAYTLLTNGHEWSGGLLNRIRSPFDEHLDLSAKIWQFFSNY